MPLIYTQPRTTVIERFDGIASLLICLCDSPLTDSLAEDVMLLDVRGMMAIIGRRCPRETVDPGCREVTLTIEMTTMTTMKKTRTFLDI